MSGERNSANFFSQFVAPALCLLCVCLVTTALLALTNQLTAPIIAQNLNNEAAALYRVVLPEAESFEKTEVQLDGKIFAVQKGLQNEEVKGYVMTTEHNGYGGPVVVLTGLSPEGVITGVQILSMEETAGLGMNAEKPEFLNQYIGRADKLTVVKTEPKSELDIQAISGATITSNAVTNSVNQAMELLKIVREGGQP